MRKLATLAALLISTNTFATSDMSHLNSAITTNYQNHTGTNRENVKLYGGKDFSRSLMANAHESVWSGQPTFIG